MGFAVLASLGLGLSSTLAKDMTAEVVMKEMPTKERFAFVAGIVHGLAYARFRKDSAGTGEKVETGSKCIYDWFYSGDASTMLRIEKAFEQYPDYPPGSIVAVLAIKECGE